MNALTRQPEHSPAARFSPRRYLIRRRSSDDFHKKRPLFQTLFDFSRIERILGAKDVVMPTE